MVCLYHYGGRFRDLQNYTTLKRQPQILANTAVLEIYRITLLSNYALPLVNCACVLEIYRITLLSNGKVRTDLINRVLEIYRITLLSNGPSGQG